MIEIVVLLEVKESNSFAEYERNAIKIMRNYGGKLIGAFEPNKTDSTTSHIDEVHYLQFPTIEAFNAYRNDPNLLVMSKLRNKAISNTTVYLSGKLKSYA